mmetsp:Transcript_24906/g.77948  ORF Transcript_24906/g.77948 Transcript_24906/m.77948 type:complete len:236 (+) Transcript_24906:368-1075(+)
MPCTTPTTVGSPCAFMSVSMTSDSSSIAPSSPSAMSMASTTTSARRAASMAPSSVRSGRMSVRRHLGSAKVAVTLCARLFSSRLLLAAASITLRPRLPQLAPGLKPMKAMTLGGPVREPTRRVTSRASRFLSRRCRAKLRLCSRSEPAVMALLDCALGPWRFSTRPPARRFKLRLEAWPSLPWPLFCCFRAPLRCDMAAPAEAQAPLCVGLRRGDRGGGGSSELRALHLCADRSS